MSKSIFSKLFAMFMLLVLLSGMITTAILFGFLENYIIDERAKLLKKNAEKIAEMTTVLVENQGRVQQRFYNMNIENISSTTGTVIFVLDNTGTLFAAANANRIHSVNLSKIQNTYISDALNDRVVQHVGTLGGVFDQTTLSVGTPIKYSGKIIGCVFISIPMPEINSMRSDLMYIFLLAIMVASLVALMFSIYFSKILSTPLKKLSRAASSIAAGNFSTRVNVKSKDEIGELAQTFNYMAESLEHLEDTRRNFIANISHELRTPMTTISGFIEGVLDGTISPEDEKKYLTVSLNETKRLSRLVTGLLELARVEAGEKELKMQEFDINELIRLCIIKFEQKITEKNLDVSIEFYHDETPVRGDKDSIERVITNLLDNAVKFTPYGGKIIVKTIPHGSKINISIENTGEGIPENEITQIWDKFYKTDKSRSEDKSGVGLGLHIVKTIINQHKQKIWIESTVGQFTRFTFTLDKV